MVSVLILTLNEEVNIGRCLDSVRWSDDVVVFDSFSSDRTVEIARAAGARVVQRRFDNWAAHQNWAMAEVEFRYPWVFYLDADERMTPELWREVTSIAANNKEQRVAFYCGRKNYLMGRWIRHAMPPGALMRFFRPQYVRFERLVNPVPVVQGDHGYLQNHFLHYNFSKGFAEWIQKHNAYSDLEAQESLKSLASGNWSTRDLLARDSATRRRALKELSFRLPLRPLLKFLYLYCLKRGFLDGHAGFTYCVLQLFYEYMIVLKMKEIQRRERGLGM